MLRLVLCLFAALAGFTSVSAMAQQAPAAIPDVLSLTGNGLVWQIPDGEDVDFLFGQAQQDVNKTSQKFWRMAEDSGTMAECGAGPIDFLRFESGVQLHFQEGAFVGWAMGPSEPGLSVMPSGIGRGTTRGALEMAVNELDVFESSLGTEFATPDGVFGTLSGPANGDVIEYLWAGTSCNFR